MQATDVFPSRTILAKDLVPPMCRSENEEVTTPPHERAVESVSANQLSIPSTTNLWEQVVATQPANAQYTETPSDPPVPVGFAFQYGVCDQAAEAYMIWSGIGLPVFVLNPDTLKTDPDVPDNDADVYAYLNAHPDRLLGCFPDEQLVVFECSTADGIAALRDAERQLSVNPALVLKNDTIEQHIFSHIAGITVKSSSIPGVTLKTGMDMLVLPPHAGLVVQEPKIVGLDLTLSQLSLQFLKAFSTYEATPAALALLENPVSQPPKLSADAQNQTPQLPTPASKSLLARFYITDVGELERQAQEQVPILGQIVLAGQATVLYARPNTGKTLITLHLVTQGILEKRIDPSRLVYIDMDDNSSGLAEKARIAQEFGFPIVADGYHGFQAKAFWKALELMVEHNTAHGHLVILDTLKKFVNTMDKKESSEFAKLARKFVMKGGTIIALAHVNKRPGANGKPVYGGTTDILDDFDCAYTIDTIDENPDTCTKVVEFENIKRRGNVPLSASYAFSTERGISYNELLLSVREIAADDMDALKREQCLVTDATVIAAIESCILEGTNAKMLLAEAVAERASISKRQAIRTIEKYTGTDPAVHRWHFVVKDRGAKVFVLLEQPAEQASTLTDSAD